MPAPEENPSASGKPMRLQRYLAQCGLGSRRECEEYITAGRVEIDGTVVTRLGTTVDPAQQTVSLDGERLKLERKKYFMLNKPPGFLCTANDPEGRRRVLDLFPEEGPRLFTVGRLDENTTGLLIVTNDGDLAQKLAHPRYRIFRLYRAQVAGQPGPEIFQQLKDGLFFTEGRFRVYDVKPVKKQKDSTWVEVTMTEGQNREIRRLFARVGHKIMKLERIGYGPLRLGRVPLGEYRDLSRNELASLHSILQRNQQGGAAEPPEGSAPARPPRQSSGRKGSGGSPSGKGRPPHPPKKPGQRRSAERRTDDSGEGGSGARKPSGPRSRKGKPSGPPRGGSTRRPPKGRGRR